MLRKTLLTLAATFMLAMPAFAQDAEPSDAAPAPAEQTLLSESVSLEVLDGSIIPEDCQYPATLADTARFELACVTMPRFVGGELAAAYIGQLGAQGWHQGSYITGGITAVRTDENNCENVLNIFPGDFPPGTARSDIVVIWFARERAPRCPA